MLKRPVTNQAMIAVSIVPTTRHEIAFRRII
jgi:hypothetical protein